MRIALLSDLHKGQRDGADDFTQCEPTYLAAIDHYWQQGSELWLLGDVEELWENFPRPVISAYSNVLGQEKPFAELGERYLRLVGNHDDQWYEPDQVEKHLGPYLAGQPVVEAVRLAVLRQGEPLGELFLVHGHQGTLDSDKYARFSAWIVRHVWRPIQRLLKIKSTTPSNNFELKQQHELAMYTWAASTTGLVLVAGHTHHPVWEGLSYQQALERELDSRSPKAMAENLWAQQQVGGRIELPGEKPCYFNTGCCSYSDASCTALELEDGHIRLVRWENPENPGRIELFTANLAEVLQAVAAPEARSE
jgi:UDP-2,3-diacylglucosamine pyrophosphatase LpxH